MAISNVLFKNNYYQIYDECGRKINEISSSYGELCGFGTDFLVFWKDKHYITRDVKGNKIHDAQEYFVGEFSSISLDMINFTKGQYAASYDKNFRKINQKHI